MKDKRLFCEKSYWERFKEYHEDDMWGLFLKWLSKINRRKKKNEMQ